MAAPIEVVVRIEPESKDLLERLIKSLEELRRDNPTDSKAILDTLSNALRFEEKP
jgi:hypothetical protein